MSQVDHQEMFGQSLANGDPPVPPVCYELDPTRDPRWAVLVDNHPRASVFHTVGWLRTLRNTYGYEPVAFTTSAPNEELQNGIVFCRIRSLLTGRRLVSLPFSDHCDPLLAPGPDLVCIVRHLQKIAQREKCKYFEVRAVRQDLGQSIQVMGGALDETYFLHVVNLRPALNEVFRSLDRDSVQRRIKRADRAGLAERCGNSEDLLQDFYALFAITRRRHCVPPTPYSWFQNLLKSQGAALEIRTAYNDRTPIAAILTLRFRDVLYYKYGGTDPRFNRFAAMPWLFWRAISAAKANGISEFDMGRTRADEEGLLAFKNHWDAHPRHLFYVRYPQAQSMMPPAGWKSRTLKKTFSLMPEPLLRFVGTVIYRHVG